MAIDLSDFLEIVENAESVTRLLSGSTVTLLNSALSEIGWRSFRNGDEELTSEERDDMEAMISLAFDELNGDPEPAFFTIFGDVDAAFIFPIDDTTPVNLGVVFEVDEPGLIHGIRIWRRELDANGAVGALYNYSGDLLASADFPDDELGWIFAEFDEPVSIANFTSYIAAYHSPDGRFVSSPNFFDEDYESGHFVLPNGGNGRYAYDGSLIFPTNSFSDSNYWVDVRYTPDA